MDFFINGSATVMAKSLSGNIYVGGNFTSVGNNIDSSGLAVYNTNTYTWSNIDTHGLGNVIKLEYDNTSGTLYGLFNNNNNQQLLNYYQGLWYNVFTNNNLYIYSFCLDAADSSLLNICYAGQNNTTSIKTLAFYKLTNRTNNTYTPTGQSTSYSNNIIMTNMVSTVASYFNSTNSVLFLTGNAPSSVSGTVLPNNLYYYDSTNNIVKLLDDRYNILNILPCPIGVFTMYQPRVNTTYGMTFYSVAPMGFTNNTSYLNINSMNPIISLTNSCFDGSNNLYICGKFGNATNNGSNFNNTNIIKYTPVWADAISSDTTNNIQPQLLPGLSSGSGSGSGSIISTIISNNNNIYLTGIFDTVSSYVQPYQITNAGIYNSATNTIGKNCYDIIHNNNFIANSIKLQNYLINILTQIKTFYNININILSDFNKYINTYAILFESDNLVEIPYNLISNFIIPSTDISENNPATVFFALSSVLSPSNKLQADLGVYYGAKNYYFPTNNNSSTLQFRVNGIDYGIINLNNINNVPTMTYSGSPDASLNSSCTLGSSLIINPINKTSITLDGYHIGTLLNVNNLYDILFQTNGIVNVIKADTLGNIYIGGQFTQVGAGLAANNIASFNINTNTWNTLDGGIGGRNIFNGIAYPAVINAIAIDSNNNVCAGGDNISTIYNWHAGSSRGAIGIAQWINSSSNWRGFYDYNNEYSVPFNDDSSINPSIKTIAIDSSDNIYIGGHFKFTINSRTIYNLAQWENLAWNRASSDGIFPGLVDNKSTGSIYCIAFDNNGIMYIGGHNFRILFNQGTGIEQYYCTSIACLEYGFVSAITTNTYASGGADSPDDLKGGDILLNGPITSITFDSHNNLFCTLTNYNRNSDCEIYYIFTPLSQTANPDVRPNASSVYLINNISFPISPTNNKTDEYYKPNAMFFDVSNNLYIGSQFPKNNSNTPTTDIVRLAINYNTGSHTNLPLITSNNYLTPTINGVGSLVTDSGFDYDTDGIYTMCYINNKIYIGGDLPGLFNICCFDIPLNTLVNVNIIDPGDVSFSFVQNSVEQPITTLKLNNYIPDVPKYTYYFPQLPNTGTLESQTTPQYLPYSVQLQDNTIYYINNAPLHTESTQIITDSFTYCINAGAGNTKTAKATLNITPAIVAYNIDLSLIIDPNVNNHKINIDLSAIPYANTNYFYYTIMSYPISGSITDISGHMIDINKIPLDISNNFILSYISDMANYQPDVSFTYIATEIYNNIHTVSNLKTVNIAIKYPPTINPSIITAAYGSIQEITLNGTAADSETTLTYNILGIPGFGDLSLDSSFFNIISDLPTALPNNSNTVWYRPLISNTTQSADLFLYSIATSDGIFDISANQPITIQLPPVPQNSPPVVVQKTSSAVISLAQNSNNKLKYFITNLPNNGGELFDVLDLSHQLTNTSSYYINGLSSSSVYYYGISSETFSYKILDTTTNLYSLSDSTVAITVEPTPTVLDISYNAYETQELSITNLYRSDISLPFRIASLPTHGSLYYNNNNNKITLADISNNTNFSENNFIYYLNTPIISPTDSFTYYIYNQDLNISSNHGTINIKVRRIPNTFNFTIAAIQNQLNELQLNGINRDSNNSLNYYITSLDSGSLFANNINTGAPLAIPTPKNTPLASNKIYYLPSEDSGIISTQLKYYVQDSVNLLQSSPDCTVGIDIIPGSPIVGNNYTVLVNSNYLACDLSENITGTNNTYKYSITQLPQYGTLIDPSGNIPITVANTILRTSIVNYIPNITGNFPTDTFYFTYVGSIYAPELANINIKYPPVANSSNFNISTGTSTQITLPINYLYNIPIGRITSSPSQGNLYYDASHLLPLSIPCDLSANNTIWYWTDYDPAVYSITDVSFSYTARDSYFTIPGTIGITITPRPKTANKNITIKKNINTMIDLNCNLPTQNALIYIITSLPSHGTLYDDGSAILQGQIPYSLTNANSNIITNPNSNAKSLVNYYNTTNNDSFFTYQIYDSTALLYSNADASVNITCDHTTNNIYAYNCNLLAFDNLDNNFGLNGSSDVSLSYIISSLPAGTLKYNTHIIDASDVSNNYLFATNNFTYINTNTLRNTDLFTYKVRDAQNHTSTIATVSIINAHFPNSYDIDISINEGSILNFDLSGSDVSSNILRYYIDTKPTQGYLYLNDNTTFPVTYKNPGSLNKTLWYLSNPDISLNDTITYHVNNGYLDSTPSNININIIHKPHVKTTDTINYTNYDVSLIINLYGLDYDDPNQTNLKYVIDEIPSFGSFIDLSNHTIISKNQILSSNQVLYHWDGSDNTYRNTFFEYHIIKNNNQQLISDIGKYIININFPPNADNLTLNQSIDASQLIFDLSGSSFNNTNSIKYQITRLPNYGILKNNNTNITINTDLSSNHITFIDSAYNAQDASFTYLVIDASSNMTTAATGIIHKVIVPTVNNLVIYANENQKINIDLSANNTNIVPLTYHIRQMPLGGYLYLDTSLSSTVIDLSTNILNKTIAYKSQLNIVANDYFRYYVSNGYHNSLDASVNIIINYYPLDIKLLNTQINRTINRNMNIERNTEVSTIDRNTVINTVLGYLETIDIDPSANYTYLIPTSFTSPYFYVLGNTLYLKKSLKTYSGSQISINVQVTKYNYNNQVSNNFTKTFIFNIVGNIPVPCMTADTEVLTPYGFVNITLLKSGFHVITEDQRIVKIINVFKSKFIGNDKTYPYIIKKNSISKNYPSAQLKLSAYHLIKYKNKWICPKTCKWFKQDRTQKIVIYYHIELENYITDNLIVNGGTVVESMTSLGENKARDKLEWHKRFAQKYKKIIRNDTTILPKKFIKVSNLAPKKPRKNKIIGEKLKKKLIK